MNPFIERLMRAARLEPALYEEVEADATSLNQSMAVVVLSSVAAGIGGAGGGLGALIGGAIGALVGWFIWAWLAYIIGTQLLPEEETRADLGQLLRTTGFSAAPGLLRVLGIVPGLQLVVFFATGLWMLAAMIVAVRQALDYESTWRAVAVCLVGFIVQVVVVVGVVMLIAGFATT